jgi:sulfur-carrier protein
MSIKVKFFARMRDEAGIDSGEVEYVDGLSLESIWTQLVSDSNYPESVMVAVNMEYVSGELTLQDGDEIAFFPPVTGG